MFLFFLLGSLLSSPLRCAQRGECEASRASGSSGCWRASRTKKRRELVAGEREARAVASNEERVKKGSSSTAEIQSEERQKTKKKLTLALDRSTSKGKSKKQKNSKSSTASSLCSIRSSAGTISASRRCAPRRALCAAPLRRRSRAERRRHWDRNAFPRRLLSTAVVVAAAIDSPRSSLSELSAAATTTTTPCLRTGTRR